MAPYVLPECTQLSPSLTELTALRRRFTD